MSKLSRYFLACVLALVPAAALADGPGVLKLDEDSFEVSEEAGAATITVERSQGEDGAVSVQLSTSDGTATAGQDYTPVSITLTWGSGDGSDRAVTIPILNDSQAEGAETIRLRLSNPAGGATVSSERGTSVVVIRASDGGAGAGGGGDDNGGNDDNGGGGGGNGDGDRAGVLKFDEREFVALESGGVALITVERSRGETGAVSVQLSTSNGTATAGQDYTATSVTLTWGSGDESRRTVRIPILDDGVDEGSETVLLRLTSPTGGAAVDGERGTAVLRIVESGSLDDDRGEDDDDGNDHNSRFGELKFEERGFQAIEGQPFAIVEVERSRGARGAVSVQYATSDLSARAGQDYQAVSGTLTWAAGEKRTQRIQIPILDDQLSEGNETVRLTLGNPTGGARLDDERETAVLTILDDDGQTGACLEDGDTACLLNDRFRIEVVWRTRDGQTGVGHVVPFSGKSVLVWFFDPDNVEMLIKAIDACTPPFNGFWIFFAATTDVDFTVTVTDTRTGLVKEYKNPAGNPAEPVQDTLTFATCG